MRVFGDAKSGNCYKVQLLLALLARDYEWVPTDILAGETQTVEFLSLNPNGKIPLLQLDDGRCLSESNAILNYLAHGSDFSSPDSFEFAQILQWQFFEQYSHEPYIAVARFIAKYLGLPDNRRAEYEAKQEGGHKALALLEQALMPNDYLVGNRLTTADIALYAYTHVAEEGGFDLQRYPAVRAWLSRVESAPGYVAMA